MMTIIDDFTKYDIALDPAEESQSVGPGRRAKKLFRRLTQIR